MPIGRSPAVAAPWTWGDCRWIESGATFASCSGSSGHAGSWNGSTTTLAGTIPCSAWVCMDWKTPAVHGLMPESMPRLWQRPKHRSAGCSRNSSMRIGLIDACKSIRQRMASADDILPATQSVVLASTIWSGGRVRASNQIGRGALVNLPMPSLGSLTANASDGPDRVAPKRPFRLIVPFIGAIAGFQAPANRLGSTA